MVNNVQQHDVGLIEHESKMMTQFQEMLTLFKSASNVQSAPVPANKNDNNNKMKKNTGNSQNQHLKYYWTHTSFAHTSKECNIKLRVTKMMHSLPTCLEVHLLVVIGYKNDRLRPQIVSIN